MQKSDWQILQNVDNRKSQQKNDKKIIKKLQSCGGGQQKTQHFVFEKFFKKSLKKCKKIVDIKFF